MQRPKSKARHFAAWVAVVTFGSFALAAAPALADETPNLRATIAATTKPTAVAAANPQDVSKLKEEMAAMQARHEEEMATMQARLDLIESQQRQQAENSLAQAQKQAEEKAKAAKAHAPGTGVHIVETANTNVRLYGLLEATLGNATNSSATGASAVGMPVSWFSGNRWGIDITQKLSADGGSAPNRLDLIAKLESEFELPSGNEDTPGVLFNRDAWIGVQSKTFGKLTIGRQNALPRDVAQIWGDPYGRADNSTAEGGFSNTNNFKQLIFYASGGNGANGQGDTRYDSAIVWKNVFPNGLFLSAAYNFGDANGPDGPNGSGPVPGAYFNKGSTVAGGIGFNSGRFHTAGYYTTSSVFEPKTIGGTNVAHQDESLGIGGNWDGGLIRLNTGFMYYTGDQGSLGRRFDKAWTVSSKIRPTKYWDTEWGVQEFIAGNAAVNGAGYVLRPFRDATGGKGTISGTRFTLYGSVMLHPMSNVDLYLVGDDLLTGGGYLDSHGHGSKHVNEVATGARYKF